MVKVGDMVITHRDQFGRVLEVSDGLCCVDGWWYQNDELYVKKADILDIVHYTLKKWFLP